MGLGFRIRQGLAIARSLFLRFIRFCDKLRGLLCADDCGMRRSCIRQGIFCIANVVIAGGAEAVRALALVAVAVVVVLEV